MAKTLNDKFKTALEKYISHLVLDYDKWTSRSLIMSKSNISMLYEYEIGQKFVKVIDIHNGGRSVHSFVSLGSEKWPEGTILKAATWAAPAQNFARGNIFDIDTYIRRAKWTGIS